MKTAAHINLSGDRPNRWGGITGNIADQADLNTILDSFADDLNDLTDTEVTASVELPDQTWSQNIAVTVLDQTINKGKALINADTQNWHVGEMRLKVTRIKFGTKKSSIAKIKVVEG